MGDWLAQIEDVVGSTLGISPAFVEKIFLTVGVALLLLLARRIFLYVISRRLGDPARRYIAVKTVNYLLGLGALLALLRIWLGGTRAT